MWRHMDRMIAPMRSQLRHGGITSRDWFSLRLSKHRKQLNFVFCVFFFCLPVKSIEHLNGDKYRKSHCGRMRVVKDVASDARRKRGRVAIEVRREVLPRQLRARRVEHVPPSCSKDSCRANVHYKKRKEKKRKLRRKQTGAKLLHNYHRDELTTNDHVAGKEPRGNNRVVAPARRNFHNVRVGFVEAECRSRKTI